MMETTLVVSTSGVSKQLFACTCLTLPNIHSPLVMACTLHVITRAEAEWYFSQMRQIKTCCRSTISEVKLLILQ